MGLTLNGEKTRILRAATAIARLEPAKARFEKKRDEAMDAATATVAVRDEYTGEEWLPDPDDVDRDLTLEDYDRLVAGLNEDDLPPNFHADVAHLLRRLESIKDPHAVASVPDVVRRAPDLADNAMRYVAAVASIDPSGAVNVFAEVLKKERFPRDFEKLSTCHRALSLEPDPQSGLAEVLGDIALTDAHDLIRAKALVAWGRHSGDDEVSVAERFLRAAGPTWRPYAFVAAQAKTPAVRDELYDRWSGSAKGLSRIAHELRAALIKWTRL